MSVMSLEFKGKTQSPQTCEEFHDFGGDSCGGETSVFNSSFKRVLISFQAFSTLSKSNNVLTGEGASERQS